MKKINHGNIDFYDDNQEEFVVSYYLLEDIGYYGVSLEKSFKDCDIVEVEQLPHISDSIEKAMSILNLLKRYQVTPVTLPEAVDQLHSMEDINDGGII